MRNLTSGKSFVGHKYLFEVVTVMTCKMILQISYNTEMIL